jgi:hypothetical protein
MNFTYLKIKGNLLVLNNNLINVIKLTHKNLMNLLEFLIKISQIEILI